MTSSPSTEPAPRLRVSLGLATVSGVLYFGGFVGFDQFYLIWLCFVPVLFAIRGASAKRVLGVGAVFGLVTNMGGYYWVIHLLTAFANLSMPLAGLGYFLLCLYQGFLLALVLLIVHSATTRLHVAPVWSLPVAFVALEKAYPLLFPSYIGNSQYLLSAVTQIVEVTGMLGLTALIGLSNGAVFEVLQARLQKRSPVRRRWLVPLVCVTAAVIYGVIRIPMVESVVVDADKLKVAMVQTNLGARDKAGKGSEFRRRHVAMSLAAVDADPDIDLIVWPESAYNRWIDRKTANLSDQVVGGIGKPVLFGALTWDKGPDGEARKYNTAILTDSDGTVLGLFDKVVLLVFGETIPLIDTFPQLKTWLPRTSLFTRGTNLDHLKMRDGTTLLPMICYEDIIPGFVRDLWSAAGPPEVLVNVTNDSWYGDTNEPLIHLVLASFRSIETRRAMIRSTNTGISAFVDPVGRIRGRTGQWKQQTLVGEVPLIKDGSATIYMMLGDVLGWLAIALVVAGGVKSRRRR